MFFFESLILLHFALQPFDKQYLYSSLIIIIYIRVNIFIKLKIILSGIISIQVNLYRNYMVSFGVSEYSRTGARFDQAKSTYENDPSYGIQESSIKYRCFCDILNST